MCDIQNIYPLTPVACGIPLEEILPVPMIRENSFKLFSQALHQ